MKALGEFLPLLTVTQKTWKDIALAYLNESFDRTHLYSSLRLDPPNEFVSHLLPGNVYWVLQKHPLLATTLPHLDIDEKRYNLTFESSIVSRMFSVAIPLA